MLETYLAIDEQVKYYDCSDFPFNFKLIGMCPAHLRPLSAQTILSQIHKWIDNTPKEKLANWVVKYNKQNIFLLKLHSKKKSKMVTILSDNLLTLFHF